VDYLFNDRSLHGQFHDTTAFAEAVDVLMAMRDEINRLGSALYCHRAFAHAPVMPDTPMQQAVKLLSVNKRRAVMSWIARLGPYWEDARLHSENDYLEVDDEIVTDTAIGESAICISRKLPRELVGLSPSDWLTTPICVNWVREDRESLEINVPNHWTLASLQASLQHNPVAISSWAELEDHLRQACTRLIFVDDAFEPLRGHPFVVAASIRINVLMHILNELKDCFTADGEWTPEGRRILDNHFRGSNSWFSDSSATEKRDFSNELSFRHPTHPDETLICSWHGKVQTPPYRIHFSWPIARNTPLYVVYVGTKLTKK
jgi:hypothetical protein